MLMVNIYDKSKRTCHDSLLWQQHELVYHVSHNPFRKRTLPTLMSSSLLSLNNSSTSSFLSYTQCMKFSMPNYTKLSFRTLQQLDLIKFSIAKNPSIITLSKFGWKSLDNLNMTHEWIKIFNPSTTPCRSTVIWLLNYKLKLI